MGGDTMSKIVENVISNLKKSNLLDSSLIGELTDHYELNNLTNVSIREIDGEEGIIVLDKALGYEIFFINTNSYEMSKLYWTLDESEARVKYKEMQECCE